MRDGSNRKSNKSNGGLVKRPAFGSITQQRQKVELATAILMLCYLLFSRVITVVAKTE